MAVAAGRGFSLRVNGSRGSPRGAVNPFSGGIVSNFSQERSEGSLSNRKRMNVLTYSEARAGFKQAMDEVCRDHTPMLITRQSGENVVMVSLDDFNAMQETLYLLSSSKNAQRLARSIAQLNAGGAAARELLTDEPTEKPQRGSRKG
ncbi:type II toxin-antitoxin system Phd/YefM family antitoxin [Paraburkholderia sp. DD10]